MQNDINGRGIVLIPAYNESKTIENLVCQIKDLTLLDVVVVDDCSTDNTATIAKRADAIVLPLVANLGAWNATQTGIRYAVQHNFDFVVTMDADGQHLPGTLPTLLQHISKEYNVIVGACPQRGSRLRHFAWGYFRRLTGLSVEDLTSGFRIYDANAMALLASANATLMEYQDVGVLLMARSNGLKIKEVPIEMQARAEGKSRVFNTWFKVLYYMLHTSIMCLSKIKTKATCTEKSIPLRPNA